MIKKLLIIAILANFLIWPILIIAKDDSLPGPGLTPDSPFYFLKTWKEKIQLFFTFGTENKAKQYLHLAEVRFAEYQKMLEKSKTEIAEKTLEKYEKILDKASQKIEELQEKKKDVKSLWEKLERSMANRIEVLKENLEKVPEQAKEGIQQALDNSKKKLERFQERFKKEGLCEDKCGDGTCQEIVCLGVGCPCAETKESCPQDCTVSQLNYKAILKQMFPQGQFVEIKQNECFKDVVKYPNFWETFGYRIFCIEKTEENFFIKENEKNLLFIFDYDVSAGWPHAAGLEHKELAVFDINGKNLLIGPSEFFSDRVNFTFYDCNGITYIVYTPEAGITDGLYGGIELWHAKEGKFKKIWDGFDLANELGFNYYSDSIIAEPKEDRIIIYKKEKIGSDFICPTQCIKADLVKKEAFIYWHELYWDNKTCRFQKLQTTDWNTYRNEKYGFEFKYPQDLNIGCDENACSFVLEPISKIEGVVETVSVSVTITDKTEFHTASKKIEEIQKIIDANYVTPPGTSGAETDYRRESARYFINNFESKNGVKIYHFNYVGKYSIVEREFYFDTEKDKTVHISIQSDLTCKCFGKEIDDSFFYYFKELKNLIDSIKLI